MLQFKKMVKGRTHVNDCSYLVDGMMFHNRGLGYVLGYKF